MSKTPKDDLPEELARGARQLRAMEAPEGFEHRLRHALARADREQAAARSVRRAHWARWLVFVPSLAALAIALHVVVSSDAQEEVGRFEERYVELPVGEHAFVDLDLWVHHHHDDSALVHVEAPESVSLHVGNPAQDLPPTLCQAQRCVHRYVHTDGSSAPLRVRIEQPGRYDIHVEHTSPSRRVREHFVVHAR